MSFGICSAGLRAMPSVPRPPALLTAATRGTEDLPAMPPSTIGCRIRSRSQTGVWIKGVLPEEWGPVQFNAFVVTVAPACIVPSRHEVSSHFGQFRLKAVKVLIVRLDGVRLDLVAGRYLRRVVSAMHAPPELVIELVWQTSPRMPNLSNGVLMKRRSSLSEKSHLAASCSSGPASTVFIRRQGA